MIINSHNYVIIINIYKYSNNLIRSPSMCICRLTNKMPLNISSTQLPFVREHCSVFWSKLRKYWTQWLSLNFEGQGLKTQNKTDEHFLILQWKDGEKSKYPSICFFMSNLAL